MTQKRSKFPVGRAVYFAAVTGYLVDQFGFAGAGVSTVLRTNDITRPATAYNDAIGQVMHFSWLSMVDLATDLNNVVQYHYNR